ncbi:ASKHA domain-containing protein [Geminisphaera colitermitum]|uniref:ASKHA domain-containing protein n=1 Tax=Geminisphaera colitermitum TaxID=1148786 RepID=UPI0012FECF13|nr:ASKHA domain-containing protein [Geminisphaera colitermitum]
MGLKAPPPPPLVGALRGDTPVHLLPGLAAFVGADITAGIHATGMAFDAAPALLVDIGTNGEIVLQSDGRLIGCATAAGPAFEGSGLLSGTRAQAGAISHIRIHGNATNAHSNPLRIELETIGDRPPASAPGICGSAYVDILATAHRCGLLLPSGRFDADVWQHLPSAHRAPDEQGRTLRLAAAGDARIGEGDIALLLQAKAALGAGIETLLDVAGIRPSDIGRVYLAGGFGLHLDVANAIAIGLLPGFEPAQVRVVGNTSLGGALLAALDRDALPAMEELRARIQIVELNQHPRFEDRYLDHLALP